MKEEYAVVPGILRVASNRDRIPAFGFGDRPARGDGKEAEGGLEEPLRVEFEVARRLSRPEGLTRRYHFFWGREGRDDLFFERRLLGPVRARALIAPRRDVPLLRVNRPYYRYCRLRVNNLYPPGTLLTDMACVRLLEAGLLPVHCAAVAGPRGAGAALLFGPSNTGKTLTAVRSVSRYGASLVAEDLAVLDGRRVHSTPLRSTLQTYSEDRRARGPGIVRRLVDWLPALVPYMERGRKLPGESLGGGRVRATADVEAVVVMETGSPGISELEAGRARERMANLNRYDLHYWRDPALIAHAYFHPDVEVGRLGEAERSHLQALAAEVPAYRIRAEDALDYAGLLATVMGWQGAAGTAAASPDEPRPGDPG